MSSHLTSKKRIWCAIHKTVFLPPERCRDCMGDEIERLQQEVTRYESGRVALCAELDGKRKRVAELERNRDLLESSLKAFVARAARGAEPPTVQQWIDAKKRKPTHIYSVLGWLIGPYDIAIEEHAEIVVWNPERKQWQCGGYGEDDVDVQVSHWMDLPLAPSTKDSSRICIYKSGCKHPATCDRLQLCVPGGESEKPAPRCATEGHVAVGTGDGRVICDECDVELCLCETAEGKPLTRCAQYPNCRCGGPPPETNATQSANPDDETPCQIREDGLHCECWYGGNKCCGCGDGDRTLGGEWPTCAEVRAKSEGASQ